MCQKFQLLLQVACSLGSHHHLCLRSSKFECSTSIQMNKTLIHLKIISLMVFTTSFFLFSFSVLFSLDSFFFVIVLRMYEIIMCIRTCLWMFSFRYYHSIYWRYKYYTFFFFRMSFKCNKRWFKSDRKIYKVQSAHLVSNKSDYFLSAYNGHKSKCHQFRTNFFSSAPHGALVTIKDRAVFAVVCSLKKYQQNRNEKKYI